LTADEAELVRVLPHFLASPHPVYLRHNALLAVIDHDPHFAIGQAELVQNGSEVTILVYGLLFREALAASDLLAAQGISVRLLNLRTVWPVDETAVLAAAHQTNLLVIIEDHFLTGGLFSIVSELLVRRGVRANVLPIALENRWFQPALLDDVLAHEGFTGPQLAEKIQDYLATDYTD
jgi:transketolase